MHLLRQILCVYKSEFVQQLADIKVICMAHINRGLCVALPDSSLSERSSCRCNIVNVAGAKHLKYTVLSSPVGYLFLIKHSDYF